MVEALRYASVLLLLTAACQALIGLGEEPEVTPRQDDRVCGLLPAPNAECQECKWDRCCDESTACAADAHCLDGIENCLAKCWDQPCAEACLEEYGSAALGVFAVCMSSCPACVPQGHCRDLGRFCCENAGTFRDRCFEIVQTGDQDICSETYQTLGRSCIAGP